MLKTCLAGFAALALLSGAASAAPLTGQQLSATSTFGDIAPNPATIGAGVDFTVSIALEDWFTIDFTEDGLVTVRWVKAGSLGHGATHNMSFTDINGTILPIIGFNLVSTSGVTGLVQSDLAFGPESISMVIGNGTEWLDSGFFTAQMLFGDVPLPAALPLFLAGLGALGWAKRRVARA